jgi:cellulase/cellobiase CelA1
VAAGCSSPWLTTGGGTSTAWTAGSSFADSAESVASSWNATVSQSGTRVSAASVSYNGALAPGGTANWGMVVNGGNQSLTGLACALR